MTRDLHYLWCNRFPFDAARSEAFYATNHLRWVDIGLQAWDDYGELDTEVLNSAGSRIDHFVLFRSKRLQRPIYPGEVREYHYEYCISARLFGQYHDRFVHSPMAEISIEVNFPADRNVKCWGYIQPQTGEREPLIPPLFNEVDDALGLRRWSWTSTEVRVGVAYGIEWHLDELVIAEDLI